MRNSAWRFVHGRQSVFLRTSDERAKTHGFGRRKRVGRQRRLYASAGATLLWRGNATLCDKARRLAGPRADATRRKAGTQMS